MIGRYDAESPEGRLAECPNEQRTYFRAITDQTIEFFMDDMTALGFEGSSFKELDPKHPMPHMFTAEFDAFLKVEDYKGKRQEKWGISRPRKAQPLENTALDNLDTMYGHLLKKAPTKAAAKPRSAKPVAPVTADDVPF